MSSTGNVEFIYRFFGNKRSDKSARRKQNRHKVFVCCHSFLFPAKLTVITVIPRCLESCRQLPDVHAGKILILLNHHQKALHRAIVSKKLAYKRIHELYL